MELEHGAEDGNNMLRQAKALPNPSWKKGRAMSSILGPKVDINEKKLGPNGQINCV